MQKIVKRQLVVLLKDKLFVVKNYPESFLPKMPNVFINADSEYNDVYYQIFDVGSAKFSILKPFLKQISYDFETDFKLIWFFERIFFEKICYNLRDYKLLKTRYCCFEYIGEDCSFLKTYNLENIEIQHFSDKIVFNFLMYDILVVLELVKKKCFLIESSENILLIVKINQKILTKNSYILTDFNKFYNLIYHLWILADKKKECNVVFTLVFPDKNVLDYIPVIHYFNHEGIYENSLLHKIFEKN